MTRLTCLTSALALAAGCASAADMAFNRVASFPVVANMAPGADAARTSSAEIVAATEDGLTLVYTDSPLGAIDLVDITDPASPKPLGSLDMKGEPTSVTVVGRRAYVAVNTSESYTAPSGRLAVVDLDTRTEVASCDLGGQPDSVARDARGSFLSIAVENERDEDAGDGRVGQMPAGYLVQVDLVDNSAACATLRKVDLTGLAAIAPEDPEPEFVDINAADETVITLQENNHIVIVARDGTVLSHFPAGAVDLDGIDTVEDDALAFDGPLGGVLREPDSVKWLDEARFVTANEGDMDGGSRGWTVFNRDGSVVHDSGSRLERALVEVGHYPEGRSENKGVEPEAVATGTFGGTPFIFIGAERASAVGVYDATDPAAPVLTQILPSGIGPEGFVAIPARKLLVSANEEDLGEDGGARSHVMIYEYQAAPAAYPMLTSAGMAELTGWGALSGLAADADGSLWAVSDSVYGGQPRIFRIDPSTRPARITAAIPVTRGGHPAQKLDLEGIAPDGEGGFWLASEGRADRLIPGAIYHVDAGGAIEDEIALPEALAGVQTRYGFEGIAVAGDTLWLAVQREWADDPKGLAKLLAYDTKAETWGVVHYPLDKSESGWVGLSDIALHGDSLYVVERDNLVGDAAVTKKITRVPVAELKPVPLDEAEIPVVSKTEVRDLIPDLKATGGYVLDKVEGLAIAADGTAWVVTDNDGVDDSSGETMFFSFGRIDG